MKIRRAASGDVDALLALEAGFPSDALNRRNLRYLLRRPSAEVWVVDIDGQVAGELVLLFRKHAKAARIYSLVVAPACRGQGIARRLIELAEDRAIAHDCRTIKLEVRPDNGAAIALYGRMGFESTGRLAGYYEDGTDALTMQKLLQSGQQLSDLMHLPSHNKAA